MKIAAFDIGGTALKMGVMARDGRLLETARQSINDSDGDRILQAMLSWLAAHPSCEGIAHQLAGLYRSAQRSYHHGRRYPSI